MSEEARDLVSEDRQHESVPRVTYGFELHRPGQEDALTRPQGLFRHMGT
jgi:hypothetical protein